MRWAKNIAASIIFGAILIACTQVPEIKPPQTEPPETALSKIAPPSAELRQRMDGIVLRVAEPPWHSTEEGIEGASGGASSMAGKGVKGGAKVGMTVGAGTIYLGCNPGWGPFIVVTCAAGIVTAVGTTVTGAVVGGVGGLVIDAATPDPQEATDQQVIDQEAVDAAVANLDNPNLGTKPEIVLRNRLAHNIQENTSSRIVKDEKPDSSIEQPGPNVKMPIILGIQIDDFSLTREDRLSPDLWLKFEVSAGIYDLPGAGSLYQRGWSLHTKLGNFVELTGKDAVGLQRKLNDAFEKLATAIVDDIFLTDQSKPILSGKDAEDRVVASYGMILPTGTEQGEPPYRPIRFAGERERQAWLEAEREAIRIRYKAEIEEVKGNGPYRDCDLKAGLSKSGCEERAEKLSELQKQLPKALAELERTAGEAVVGALPPGSKIDFETDRQAIEQAIIDYYELSVVAFSAFEAMKDVTLEMAVGNQVKVIARYTTRNFHSSGIASHVSDVMLTKENNVYTVLEMKARKTG